MTIQVGDEVTCQIGNEVLIGLVENVAEAAQACKVNGRCVYFDEILEVRSPQEGA